MGTGSSVPIVDMVRSLPCPSPAFPSIPSIIESIYHDVAACKSKVDKGSTSNVEKFAKLVEQAGITLADYAVQFFTFVPDTTGYITVLHKTDGTLTRCAWRNVPKELDIVLEREGEKGVRHVTVGVNGAYVVILNSGAVWWGADIPGGLRQLLEDAERNGRPVAVSTMPFHLTYWLISDLTPQRPSPSPSSRLTAILSDSQMEPQDTPSPRIGTSPSTITAHMPIVLVRYPTSTPTPT